jgi:hypothetical protein
LRSLATQRRRPEVVVAGRAWWENLGGEWPPGLPGALEKSGRKIGAWLAQIILRHPGHAVAFAPRGQLCRAEKLAGAGVALRERGAAWLWHGVHACSRDYLADARAHAGPVGPDESEWGRLVLGPAAAAGWAEALTRGAPFAPSAFVAWATSQGLPGAEVGNGWQVTPSASFAAPTSPGKALADFRGQARGRRAFVIGNGPSLREMNLERLAGEITGASNRFFLLFPRLSWRPSFYACLDTQVLPDQARELAAARAAAPETAFFFPDELLDDETWKLRWSVPTLVPPDARTCYFPQRPPAWSDDPFDAFARDSAAGLVAGMTVTVCLLQLAVLYGCDPIYLIGCDHHYEVPASVRSHAALGGGPAVLHSTADDDPNHFAPDYFGRGRAWHQPNVAGMERHYAAARRAADALGVRIFNAGVNSRLEVFPRVNYDDLF